MKTSKYFNIPTPSMAHSPLLGSILILSIFGTLITAINFTAIGALFMAFESQWANFTHAMFGFMAQPFAGF